MTAWTGRRNGAPAAWRGAMWGGAAALLLAPLIAMQVTDEVNWSGRDFGAAALLLVVPCLATDSVLRMRRDGAYSAGAALALLDALAIVWTNLAVGIIGREDDPLNWMFVGVIAVAAIGAGLVRLRAAGLARVMLLTAALQAVAAAVGAGIDPRAGMLSLVFVLPWLGAAALLGRAARAERR